MRAPSRVAPVLIVRNAQRKIRVDVAALQRFASAALGECLRAFPRRRLLLDQLPALDVVVISDRRMASLHRRFTSISGPTDVITFQHGEIFVSIETARRNADDFRTSLDEELRLYVTHGILHLLGLDDSTPSAARTMDRAQRKIVAAVRARDLAS